MGIPKKAYNQYSNPWKEEEVKLLKNSFNNGNYRELSKIIGRSYDSVRTKCYSLGLKKKLPERWSKRELFIIYKNYKLLGNIELSKLLPKRNITSINSKINTLGLNRGKEFRRELSRKIGLDNKGNKWSNKSKIAFSRKLKKDYKDGLRSSNLIYRTKESMEKARLTLKKTLKEKPEILIKANKKRKITLKNNPEIREMTQFKIAMDRAINPEKYKKAILKAIKTKKNIDIGKEVDRRRKIKDTLKKNPSILKKSLIKRRKTFKEKPELLIEASKKRKEFFKKHPEKTNLGMKHTPESIRKIKKARAKQKFPLKDSSIEIKIQEFLSRLHIEYFTHKYISEITHSYQCDIFIPKQKGINQKTINQKTIIECDGCYWHGCLICNSNHHTLSLEKKEIDKIRTKELIEKGFRVIRLWEHEIRPMTIKQFEGRLNDIQE